MEQLCGGLSGNKAYHQLKYSDGGNIWMGVDYEESIGTRRSHCSGRNDKTKLEKAEIWEGMGQWWNIESIVIEIMDVIDV